MPRIEYIAGDATKPQVDSLENELVYIPHICNDIGAWGAGFVKAISRKWPTPEQEYLAWFKTGEHYGVPFRLGQVQKVNVEPGVVVVNMIAQNGVRSRSNPKPISYSALDTALARLGEYAEGFVDGANLSVSASFQIYPAFHMPRIGTGLAGGDWSVIEPIILENLGNFRIVVYDLD